MNKNKLFKFMIGLALPILTMSSANAINAAKAEQNEDLGLYTVQNLYETKYPKRDYLNEPELAKAFRTNFAPMGFGDTPDKATTWDNYRGEQVTVAVIDSGLDIYHEDFLIPEAKGVEINETNIQQYSIIDKRSASFYATDFLDPEKIHVVKDVGILEVYDKGTYNAELDRNISHGTSCAACIGAMINGVGGYGIAPNVNLLILKSDLRIISCIEAIKYAIECKADVISMSFGIFSEPTPNSTYDETAATAYNEVAKLAKDNNVILVAAAGNESTNHKSYPACAPNIIGVGGLDKYSKTKPSYFTNFNNPDKDTYNSDNNVDVMAPGYAWVAATNRYGNRLNQNATSEYMEIAGTSFATPLTAGAIALYKGKNPNATYDDVVNALYSSCKDIGYEGWDTTFGYGRVDVPNLLNDYNHLTGVTNETKKVTLKGTDADPYPTYQSKLSYIPNNVSEECKKGIWTSDNEDICIVNQNTGAIVATGTGSTNVRFTTLADNITTTIEVNVENVTKFNPELNQISCALTNNKLDIGGTEKINITGKAPLIFNNSNPNAIEIDKDGTIKALSAGDFSIRVFVGKSYLCELKGFVSPGYELTNIKVSYDTGDKVFVKYKDKYEEGGYKVIASYTNGAPDREVQATIQPLDTNKIGKVIMPVTYTECGITKTADVNFWITSEDAVANKTRFLDAYITTNPRENAYFDKNGATLGSHEPKYEWFKWTIDVESENELEYSYSDMSTSIIGTQDNYPTKVTLTSDSAKFKTIDSVIVSYTVDPGAIVTVKVGNTIFKCNGEDKFNVTEGFLDDPEFVGNAQGIITIEISNIKSPIEIGYLEAHLPYQMYDVWTPDDQAKQFSEFVKNYSSCANDWNEMTRKEIPLVINEFNVLSQSAKNSSMLLETFTDNGEYITNTINKLKMIVNQYNSTLKNGETKLQLILRLDENNNPSETYEGDISNKITYDVVSLLIIGSTAFIIISVIGFVIYKKRYN